MSRCYACDACLTDQENTRRFKRSGTFTELCTKCLHTIDDQVEYDNGRPPKEKEESEWDER